MKATGLSPPLRQNNLIWPPNDGQTAEVSSVELIDGSGLHTALMHIAKRCGVSVKLMQWHPNGAEPEAVFPNARSATSVCQPSGYQEHAEEAVLQASKQAFEGQPWQLYHSSTCCTAVMVLAGGFVTLTVVPQLALSRRYEARWSTLEHSLPFVAACFEQWLATQHAIARARSLSHALGKCGTATILLTCSGEILHANGAAEAILKEKDGLCRQNERLICANFSDTLRLQAALSHFHAAAQTGTETTPVLAVSRASRRSLTVALATVRRDTGVVADRTHAIAYVFDPEQKMSELINPVCQLYGLSNSETKLTCALVAGDTLSKAAERLDLQEQTARTYLKHIFEKTDTHRQAQLVELMLKSAVRLTSDVATTAFT